MWTLSTCWLSRMQHLSHTSFCSKHILHGNLFRAHNNPAVHAGRCHLETFLPPWKLEKHPRPSFPGYQDSVGDWLLRAELLSKNCFQPKGTALPKVMNLTGYSPLLTSCCETGQRYSPLALTWDRSEGTAPRAKGRRASTCITSQLSWSIQLVSLPHSAIPESLAQCAVHTYLPLCRG